MSVVKNSRSRFLNRGGLRLFNPLGTDASSRHELEKAFAEHAGAVLQVAESAPVDPFSMQSRIPKSRRPRRHHIGRGRFPRYTRDQVNRINTYHEVIRQIREIDPAFQMMNPRSSIPSWREIGRLQSHLAKLRNGSRLDPYINDTGPDHLDLKIKERRDNYYDYRKRY